MEDLNVRDLIRQGTTAARVGDQKAARRQFERALGLDSSNIDAWLGLCGVMETPEEKRDCFRRVLALDPDNEEANAAMEMLAETERRERVVVPTATRLEPEVLYCANHPDVETMLRCNRCGKPICTRCAIRTPVGYRCPECIREQQSTYYTATNFDYPIAGAITLVLSAIAGFFVPLIGSMVGIFGWLIMLIVGPAVAGLMAEAVRLALKRRRGRYLGLVVLGTAVVGTLIGLLGQWFIVGFGVRALIPAGIYAFLLLSTLYARTR